MNGFRAAMRLARRDALRTRGRSLLTVATIALPVAATTLVILLRNGLRGMADSGDGAAVAVGSAVNLLIIAFIVLETVLLAGPAFAVDARRRRRLLALVSASGGAPAQLRAVVLCSGLLLGGVAGVAGTACAFLLFWPARWLLIEHAEAEYLPFTSMIIPWGWIAASVLTALLSGLAAAYAPARQAARTDPAEVLAGRRSLPRDGRGLPVLGGALVVAGLASVPLLLELAHETGAALSAALLIVGCVLATPAVITLTGRFADRLPLPARLAVRDAVRNRVRTAPAVAAVTAATAALTALAIGGSSDLAQERFEYQPRMEPGQTVVDLPWTNDPAAAEGWALRIAEAVRRVVPEHPPVQVDRPRLSGSGGDVELRLAGCRGGGCGAPVQWQPFSTGYLFGGPEAVPLVLGREDPAAAAALARGRAVVFARDAVADGRVAILAEKVTEDGATLERRVVRLPAVQAEPTVRAPVVLLPREAAGRLGVTAEPAAVMFDGPISPARQERLDAELRKVGPGLQAHTERGFQRTFTMPVLVLGGAAAALVLGAALLVTALAAVDSRPDLATLTAVGARPATRRLLLMAQAGYVALLGCLLGTAAGLVPGIAVASPLTNSPVHPASPPHGTVLDIPWLFLLFVLVALPLLTAAVSGLFRRDRQVLPERTAV